MLSEDISIEKTMVLRYGSVPSLRIKSPGRINLIGEHTDYNGGWVMPAAIDKYMNFEFKKNSSGICRIYSMDFDQECIIDLVQITKDDVLWMNYLRGILLEFQERGYTLSGFDCVIQSNIPIGSGLSSSAALECGFIKGISELFDLNIDRWDMVYISHHSNHDFLGIESGILDQFACVFGRANHFLLMNCQDSSFIEVPVLLHDYQFVLINSHVHHEHLTSGYNDRVKECQEAFEVLHQKNPQLTCLSDADSDMLSTERNNLSEAVLKRANYIIEENRRVHLVAEALAENNLPELGELLYASHHGLQNKYEVSCMELDLLVDLTRPFDEVLGSRMMGGGFGGCTLNLLKASNNHIIKKIQHLYKERTGIMPDAYSVNITGGVNCY